MCPVWSGMCDYHEADLGHFIHIFLGHHDVCGHISCEPLLGKPQKDSFLHPAAGCSHDGSTDHRFCDWSSIWIIGNVHADHGLHLQFLSSALVGPHLSHQVGVPVKSYKLNGTS